MANTAEDAQNASRAEFDMEMVPELPGGRAIYPVEQQGRFVWLVAEGQMTRQCFDEMREYLRYIVDNGLWTQNWDGSPPPGSVAA